jgi:hypothetical protein
MQTIQDYQRKTLTATPDELKQRTSCGVCGGGMVGIRGRYPGDPQRVVCPTCQADRLDQISSTHSYGLWTDNLGTELLGS